MFNKTASNIYQEKCLNSNNIIINRTNISASNYNPGLNACANLKCVWSFDSWFLADLFLYNVDLIQSKKPEGYIIIINKVLITFLKL